MKQTPKRALFVLSVALSLTGAIEAQQNYTYTTAAGNTVSDTRSQQNGQYTNSRTVTSPSGQTYTNDHRGRRMLLHYVPVHNSNRKKPTLCYQRMGLQMWGEPWASLRRMNCDVPFPQILPQLSFALSRRAGIKQGLHFARVQCPVEHFQFIQTTLEEFSTSQP